MRKVFNRETIAYLFFGVLTVVVNYGVFWLTLRWLGEERALIANVITFVAATTFAYITNKLFVFQSRSFAPRALCREAAMFFGARIASFGLEELGLWICTDFLHVGRYRLLGVGGIMAAKIILSVVATVLNYFFSKFFIFRKKKENRYEGTTDHPGL